MLLDYVDSCRLKFYTRSTWDKTLFVTAAPGAAVTRRCVALRVRSPAWFRRLSGGGRPRPARANHAFERRCRNRA